jgi:enoyl-CoA hydratase
MGYNFLTIERDETVGIIKMNRPPTNPINRDFVGELANAFDELEKDESTKVIVITSALERFFVAGADIKMIANMTEKDADEVTAFFQESFQKINEMEKIVIAAINGFALGGGCELALACDYRFMAKGDHKIGLPEATLGIIPGAGGIQRLGRLLGLRAIDLLINRTMISPEEALNIGLVDAIFEQQDLMPETLKFAKKLAKGATKAMGIIKRCLNKGLDLPIREALKLDKDGFVEVFKTEDAKEGLNAFIEKRKANFKGK